MQVAGWLQSNRVTYFVQISRRDTDGWATNQVNINQITGLELY